MTIGEQIKAMRKDAGLAQRQLCEKAGIENARPNQYISAIERDKQVISIQVLERLCEACRYDVKLIKK